MNLQSRSKRWLAAAVLAKEITRKTLVCQQEMFANGRVMPMQAHKVFINAALYELRLTMEADPVSPDSALYPVLGDVVQSLAGLKLGADFTPTVEALHDALDAAVDALTMWTGDEDSKIEDIVGELERAVLISLIVTLTSHTYLSDYVEKWRTNHQRSLQGHTDDLPHYIDIKTMLPCGEPGPGRVHIQHLSSALHGGATVFIPGSPNAKVEHYPELQSIVYAQWFAYAHAIWDEQFRGRIAQYWNEPDARTRRRDVVNDFFGDVRLIRNDYVHHKGVVDEATNVKLLQWGFKKGEPLDITAEQMLSLIGLFPRGDLTTRPTPAPTGNRKTVPGSVDPDLLEDVLDRIERSNLDKNAVIDEAFTLWLAQGCD